MALYGRDANGNDAYIEAAGSGTLASPYASVHDLRAYGLLSAQVDGSASADVVAAVSGYKVRVLNLALSASAACSLRFQTGGSGNLSHRIRIPSGDTVVLGNDLGLFDTVAGDKLNVVLSGVADYGVTCSYRLVS
jgi:hypothetical protein